MAKSEALFINSFNTKESVKTTRTVKDNNNMSN